MPEKEKTVKRQPGTQGFDKHPENINRTGDLGKAWRWKEVFMEEVAKKKENQEKRLLMAQAMIDKAMAGDVAAFNSIADRMEGKPSQGVDVTTQGEKIEGITYTFVRGPGRSESPGGI